MANQTTSGKTKGGRSGTARRTAQVRISHHLKRPLASLLREARALEGRVVQQAELAALISSLETPQTSASDNCKPTSWGRTFTLKPAATAKRR